MLISDVSLGIGATVVGDLRRIGDFEVSSWLASESYMSSKSALMAPGQGVGGSLFDESCLTFFYT